MENKKIKQKISEKNTASLEEDGGLNSEENQINQSEKEFDDEEPAKKIKVNSEEISINSTPDPARVNENEFALQSRSPKSGQIREIEAIVHIYASYNNTIAHVTDMSGRTITKVSGGMITKHDRLKANPTIAMFIAKRISEKMKEEKIKNLYIRIRAKTRNPTPGPGANAIVKSLSREGFKIINILDNTRIPRGGPKIKGGRRGRRP